MTDFLTMLGHEKPLYWYVSDRGGTQTFESFTAQIDKARDHAFGTFFVVNAFGDERNRRGNLRWSGNITRPLACFIDFDAGTKAEQYQKIVSLPLQPSAVVESGRGYHVYFFLYGTTKEDLHLWKHLQRHLAALYGGDPAVNDFARVMRLPGSYHCKGEPVLVTLVELQDIKYPIAVLAEAFKTPPPPPRRVSSPGTYTPAKPLPTTILHEGERHAALIRVGASYFRGVAPSEVPERLAAFKAWYAASCRPLKDTWEHEVDEYINGWVLQRELGKV